MVAKLHVWGIRCLVEYSWMNLPDAEKMSDEFSVGELAM
jgi:hypothetical protein